MSEEKLVTASGATRSNKAPRYDLIPLEGLRRLAERYGLGARNHGENNWKKGLHDPQFIEQCFNHMIEHAYLYKLSGNATDDNLAAVAWGAFALMEIEYQHKLDCDDLDDMNLPVKKMFCKTCLDYLPLIHICRGPAR